MNFFRIAVFSLSLLLSGKFNVFAAQDPRFQAAMQAATQERYGEARQQLTVLLKEDPENNLYRFNFANILYLQGEFTAAAEFYGRVAASNSKLAIPAKLYSSKALRRSGDYEKAFKILRSLRLEELPPALRRESAMEIQQTKIEYARREGLRALRDQEYDRAARMLKSVLAMEPDADAYLAFGLASARMGRSKEAAAAIEKGRALAKDAASREDADALLQQIQTGEVPKRRKFFPELSLLVGNDSNFYADAKDINETPASKAIMRVGAKALHMISESENYALNGRYSVSYDGPVSSPADRVLRYAVEAQGIYSKNRWLAGVFPSFEQILQNTSPYYLRPGIALRGRRYWGNWEAGVNYSLAYNIPNSYLYNFLRGTVHERNVSLGFSMDKISIDLSFSFDSVLTGDLASGSTLIPLRHNSWGPTLEALLSLARRWELSALLSYRTKNYSTRSLPGLVPRDDTLTEVFIQAAYTFHSQWDAFAAVDYIMNRSTMGPTAVDNKNYNEWITYAGITWRLDP